MRSHLGQCEHLRHWKKKCVSAAKREHRRRCNGADATNANVDYDLLLRLWDWVNGALHRGGGQSKQCQDIHCVCSGGGEATANVACCQSHGCCAYPPGESKRHVWTTVVVITLCRRHSTGSARALKWALTIEWPSCRDRVRAQSRRPGVKDGKKQSGMRPHLDTSRFLERNDSDCVAEAGEVEVTQLERRHYYGCAWTAIFACTDADRRPECFDVVEHEDR